MLALGLALVVLGLVLLVIEAHAPTAGVLGAGGAIALGVGCWLVLSAGGLSGAAAVPAGTAAAIAAGAVVAVGARKALAARHLPAQTGAARLVGHTGRVRTWNGAGGQIKVDGELWRARLAFAQEQERPPATGELVVVDHAEGLTLFVRRCEPWELDP